MQSANWFTKTKDKCKILFSWILQRNFQSSDSDDRRLKHIIYKFNNALFKAVTQDYTQYNIFTQQTRCLPLHASPLKEYFHQEFRLTPLMKVLAHRILWCHHLNWSSYPLLLPLFLVLLDFNQQFDPLINHQLQSLIKFFLKWAQILNLNPHQAQSKCFWPTQFTSKDFSILEFQHSMIFNFHAQFTLVFYSFDRWVYNKITFACV